MNSFGKIYSLVSSIPKGKVTTYGTLAKLTDVSPRFVGYALHQNKNPREIPCHRVINSKGKISKGYAFGGSKKQKEILEEEGINFNKKSVVDLGKFGYFSCSEVSG